MTRRDCECRYLVRKFVGFFVLSGHFRKFNLVVLYFYEKAYVSYFTWHISECLHEGTHQQFFFAGLNYLRLRWPYKLFNCV